MAVSAVVVAAVLEMVVVVAAVFLREVPGGSCVTAVLATALSAALSDGAFVATVSAASRSEVVATLSAAVLAADKEENPAVFSVMELVFALISVVFSTTVDEVAVVAVVVVVPVVAKVAEVAEVTVSSEPTASFLPKDFFPSKAENRI